MALVGYEILENIWFKGEGKGEGEREGEEKGGEREMMYLKEMWLYHSYEK